MRVFPDGGFRVLDRNEYNYHRKVMKYPEVIDNICKSELSFLIDKKRENSGPFQEGIVDKYYKMFEEIKKN